MTERYLTDGTRVDAFQWEPELAREDWPAWTRSGGVRIGEFRFVGQANPSHLAVHTGQHVNPTMAAPGDWVVMTERGELRVYDQEAFAKVACPVVHAAT